MIKILEILAFAVSTAAFGYGAFRLLDIKAPKYFHLYVYAAGCYMLEELWVIVNTLLGNGSQDGLVTVRLLGAFGCLCFMLSANMCAFDLAMDEGKDRKAKVLACIAPVVLLVLFVLYVFSPANTTPTAVNVIGFVSISPALFASYFSLKHLLLPKDANSFLSVTKRIDILVLVFFAANYVYPIAYRHFSKTVMGVYDLILAGLFFGMIVLCVKGADKWKTLI